MGADDQILVTLSGEGPWGFRLQGGSEKKLPLLVSKVRKRSKACRGGLKENDELISINGKPCAGLSHAEAMLIIDTSGSNLHIQVKRTANGAKTAPRSHRVPASPTSPNRITSPEPLGSWTTSPSTTTKTGQHRLLHLESITSPPDSEAYYGETDSDADIRASPGHPQNTQQHHNQQQQPQEKHRRARKKSPRSPPGNNNKSETEQQSLSEMSGYESGPGGVGECAVQPTVGVAKREIVYQPGGSRAETPFSDVEGFLPTEEREQVAPSPEALLLPHATKTIRAERHLIPMIGPVDHPVDDDLTTTYSEKAKEAKLHRSESVQEKNVKEARTKCRTIASLLTDAPNPHSKGVLMFKKRRQRAKKYTLVSYGSVDEDRYIEDEDGVFPTSESEFDEEGFSDARSLTNHSDWDSTYLDIEKPKMDHEQQQEDRGLSEASGKGAALFDLQRQRSGQFSIDNIPSQNSQEPANPPLTSQRAMVNGEVLSPVNRGQENRDSERTKVTSAQISLSTPQFQPVQTDGIQSPITATSFFNRSARPFTPGQAVQRTMASSVVFKPSTPRKTSESPSVQNIIPSPFTQFVPDTSSSMQKAPVSSVASLYIPAPGKPSVAQYTGGENIVDSPSLAATPRATTASIYLSSPSRPSGSQTIASQPSMVKLVDSSPATTLTSPVSHFSPAPTVLKASPSYSTPGTPVIQPLESVNSREQRISVPVGRTGILNEARKRGGKKQMFIKKEEKKYLPNPELLSLVQNIDEKPKQDQPGAGFESGPEEDFLSLGAEACNFMQPSGRKFKIPPPVAPKPQAKQSGDELVNGAQDMPQMKGKGAELFAKRQSRMDKFVVDSNNVSRSRPNSRPRTPSPTPSLPSSWKYSSNIRAPPPIAYNPLYSPFYPLAASKSQSNKAESKVKKAAGGKPRMQAIDFMRHQPYQLNSAMFCFGDSSNSGSPSTQDTQKHNLSVTPTRQVPVKTARAHEIKRFSTPTPMSSSINMVPTVLTPRSATTLAEPVWRTDTISQPMSPEAAVPLYNLSPAQKASQYSSPPQYPASGILSPISSVTSPRASVASIPVPKPRFSASRTGMQANVWRPAKVHF
ncbi:synaptopodin 2-like protein [Bombina bombina]|uniref:synaptopodin 2-like protein n=1 Tax=Bombina bombina TaxID=8345 RepID=UPI00235A8124|nr:synaptopodin 2-like protein [Bombina bombina]